MLTLSVLAALSFSPSVDFEGLFQQFQRDFAKSYTVEEEAHRFAVFTANVEKANQLNTENSNYPTQGITKFMDLTAEEFSAMYLGRQSSNTTEELPMWNGECTACQRFPELAELVNDPPDSFDWTTKGAVTPVKDQGQCGSCWSFGTTGDIEGTWFLAKSDLVSLSEQELVSCDTKKDQGCNGGLQENAFAYVMKNGLVAEKTYRYTSGEGDTGTCKRSKLSPVVAKISSWSQVTKGGFLHRPDEDVLLKALIASGPITIGINAAHMQTYHKGIDNPFWCFGQLDHAVLLVGYGTDISTEGIGEKYWKIKNSWNTNWGEDGYYRIKRGVNKCGLANDAVHSKI